MSDRPFVSVIVIFLNENRFIQEAIESIFAQTYEALWYGLVHPGDGPATSAGQTFKSLFGP